MNPRSKSGAIPLLCIFIAFIPAMILVQQCEYFLVNDFRPYDRSFQGGWLHIILSCFNPFNTTVWLHRPLPESFEWLSSLIFKGHPGLWHVVALSFRLLIIALVWVFLGCFKCSNHARIIGTLFISFFPSFPESQLIFAETVLIPFLLITYIGLVVLYKDEGMHDSKTSIATITAVSFILTTLCKEILAPLSLAFLIFFYPLLWKRQRYLFRSLYALMSLATLLQLQRCYLTIFQPYAQGDGNNGHSLTAIFTNFIWIFADSFLVRTNVAPTSILLFFFFAIGFYQLARVGKDKRPFLNLELFCIVSFGLSVAIHLLTPYKALRYLYPGAVLLVPIIARGYDASFLTNTKQKTWIFKYLVATMFLFGLPGIYAQALSMQVSSTGDWAFLTYIVQQYSAGKDIVFINNVENYERSVWTKAELYGVNLTGQLKLGNNGRILDVESSIDFKQLNPNSIIVNAPIRRSDKNKLAVPSLVADKKFDFTKQGVPYLLLSYTQTFVKKINPLYQFVAEAGSTKFPGHYWQTYVPVSENVNSEVPYLPIE